MIKSEKTVTGVFGTLAILWVGHFLVDMLIGFWSIYKTIAHLDLAIAGIIAGICPSIGEGMQMVFGNMGDNGHRRALFIFGILGTAASVFLPFTQSYVFMFVIFLLTCLGSGAFHPTGAAITAGLTKKKKGFFMTIFATGGALGLASSHIVFSSWYANFSGNTLALALPSALMIGTLTLLTLPGTQKLIDKPKSRFSFSTIKKLFQCRELSILYGAQVCTQTIYWGTMFLLPDVLISKGYGTWISQGGGHLCYILGGALMLIPGGYLADKYSARSVLMIASICGIGLFYSFLFSPLMSDTAVLALLLALGAALGVSNPVAVALGNEIMPSRPGLVSAFMMGFVWCIAEGLGPGGGGLLTKFFTQNAPAKALSILGFLYIFNIGFTSMLPSVIEDEFELEKA